MKGYECLVWCVPVDGELRQMWLGAGDDRSRRKIHPRKKWPLLLVLAILLFLTTVALVTWAIVDAITNASSNDSGLLVLHDSQRLVLGSSLVVPVAGDKDIVLVEVFNNADLLIVNITVEADLLSAARKRAALALTVICPPLYVDNFIASLAPHTTTTCRALYTLSSEDIVTGNTLTTSSSAEGTSVDGVNLRVIAVPGTSALSINNLDIAPGAILGIPGPTGPAGPVSVVTAPCEDALPHTTLTCSTGNELQLLVCDLSSNSTQIGYIYICVGGSWIFFGAVNVNGNQTTTGPTGPTGPAGPRGIGVYAATCAGGAPPTSVTNPTYTCDSAFNLNMVLCSLASTDNTAGIIYECLCSPNCAWTEVANINGVVEYVGGHCFNFALSNTPNVWSNLCSVSLPKLGDYFCSVDGSVRQTSTTQSCALTYGISSVSQSNAWISNSNRNLNLPPMPTNPTNPPSQQWTAPIITTATISATSAPEVIYVTAGIGNQPLGCGNWASILNTPVTINCIAITFIG